MHVCVCVCVAETYKKESCSGDKPRVFIYNDRITKPYVLHRGALCHFPHRNLLMTLASMRTCDQAQDFQTHKTFNLSSAVRFFCLNHTLTAANRIFMRLKYVQIWYVLRREKLIQEGLWGFVCVYVGCVWLSLICVSPNCEISTETVKGIICLLSTSSVRTLVLRCVKMAVNSLVNQCAAHFVCVCAKVCEPVSVSLVSYWRGSRQWMNG